MLVLAAATCAVAGPIAVGNLEQPIPIEERAQRIRLGMTLAEVEVVVGEPEGSHTRYVTYIRHGLERADDLEKTWEWDEGSLAVRFDENGHVVVFSYNSNPNAPMAFQRLLYQLPW